MRNHAAYDDAKNNLSLSVRIDTKRQIAAKIETLTLKRASSSFGDRIKARSEIARLIAILGGKIGASSQEVDKPEPDVTGTPSRRDTKHLYRYESARKLSERKKRNQAARAILDQVRSGELSEADLTDEQRQTLADYSGSGGGLDTSNGTVGSDYEYYTPAPIVSGIWSALQEAGFSGGKVLDPCAGTGIFGALAPKSAVVTSVELSEDSGDINRIINGGPGYEAITSPFEAVAASTPDGIYDAVVTNVPFSKDIDARGGTQKLDERYSREPMETYFILRSLEKLRPGGVAAFICPPRCVSGKDQRQVSLRQKASLLAEFNGAYRLPNSVFGGTSADTITDVLFFTRHSAEAQEQIDAANNSDPTLLTDAKVIYPPFIDGKYFETEGKRFVLGEFIPKDTSKVRDIDRVVNPKSVPEIAAMIKKLPGSRIDWSLLSAEAPEPIIYAEGDIIYQAGVTLRYQSGEWVSLGVSQGVTDAERVRDLCATPGAAIDNKIGIKAAREMADQLTRFGLSSKIPGWISKALSDADSIGTNDKQKEAIFRVISIGGAMRQVIERHKGDDGVNFAEAYPELTGKMQRYRTEANRLASKLVNGAADAKLIISHARKNGELSPFWSGASLSDGDFADTEAVTVSDRLDSAIYQRQDPWFSIAEVEGIIGGQFDPYSSAEWCVSDDGEKVCRADDYYVGEYSSVTDSLRKAIASATDSRLKSKLVEQLSEASRRVKRFDHESMRLTIRSPLITDEERLAFLRQAVDPDFTMTELAGGKVSFNIKHKTNDPDHHKLKSAIGHYAKEGTVTLGNLKTKMDEKDALTYLHREVMRLNEQFGIWASTHPAVMGRLRGMAENDEGLRFIGNSDKTRLRVPGMRPEIELHDYQRAFIRRAGRDFSGINAFGVGLGKTFTALGAVQHAQSMGSKKKTLFVVPSAVLSNWRKEAGRAYKSIDDCLFVGLRERGGAWKKGSSADVDQDLTDVMANAHRKVFITFEHLIRIPMRPATIDDYRTSVFGPDPVELDKDGNPKKQKEGARVRKLSKEQEYLSPLYDKKSSGAPYFEDMGFDSIVIDEAHGFKNGFPTFTTKSAKFLPNAATSNRAIDALVKTWYVRKVNPKGDGVIGLTATPVTNSPLEVYTMLMLTVGREGVERMIPVASADGFLETFVKRSHEEVQTIDGRTAMRDVFVGVRNTQILRDSIGQSAVIEDAASVGQAVVIPNRDEVSTRVTLPDDTIDVITDMQQAYREMRKMKAGGGKLSKEEELIAHPLNLLNRMSMAILDTDLSDRLTRYRIDPSDKGAASDVCSAYNRLKIVETVRALSDMTPEGNAVELPVKSIEATNVVEWALTTSAWISGNNIVTDAREIKSLERLESLAEKSGVGLDVYAPPKLAAMLDNFRREESSPRGMMSDGSRSPIVKQIIFCDMLPMMRKIRLALIKKAGVEPSKIAIVTGAVNGGPDEIMEVQEGFNGHGEENRYRVIIANKKAEVGINLQNGTQAIHHLTIGWTPDSIEQRNGRGARQGNHTQAVTIYHYDADGTFDAAKRELVNHKSGWIDKVIKPEDGEESADVDVVGGLSDAEQEALIDSIGNQDAIEKIRQASAKAASDKRVIEARAAQVVALGTIVSATKTLGMNYKQRAKKINNEWSKLVKDIKSAENKKDGPARDEAIKKATERFDDYKRHLIASYRFRDHIQTSIDLSADNEDVKKNLLSTFESNIERWINSKNAQNAIVSEIEGGPAQSDRLADEDQARAMIEKAKKSFIAESKKPGALPADIIDKIDNDDAFLLSLSNEIVAAGGLNLYRNKDIIIDERGGIGIYLGLHNHYNSAVSLLSLSTHNGNLVATIDVVNRLVHDKIRHIPSTSAEYEDYLEKIAEIADKSTSADDVKTLIRYLPEVANRMKTAPTEAHHPDDTMLSAPAFGHPVGPGKNWARTLLEEVIGVASTDILAASQTDIIIEWIDNIFITALGSDKVNKDNSRYTKSHSLINDAILWLTSNGHNVSVNAMLAADYKGNNEFKPTINTIIGTYTNRILVIEAFRGEGEEINGVKGVLDRIRSGFDSIKSQLSEARISIPDNLWPAIPSEQDFLTAFLSAANKESELGNGELRVGEIVYSALLDIDPTLDNMSRVRDGIKSIPNSDFNLPELEEIEKAASKRLEERELKYSDDNIARAIRSSISNYAVVMDYAKSDESEGKTIAITGKTKSGSDYTYNSLRPVVRDLSNNKARWVGVRNPPYKGYLVETPSSINGAWVVPADSLLAIVEELPDFVDVMKKGDIVVYTETAHTVSKLPEPENRAIYDAIVSKWPSIAGSSMTPEEAASGIDICLARYGVYDAMPFKPDDDSDAMARRAVKGRIEGAFPSSPVHNMIFSILGI